MPKINTPHAMKPYNRALRFGVKSIQKLFGAQYPRQCSVCGHSGRFFSYGFPLVADALCPNCLSLERHRALAICDKTENFYQGKEVLHFAPEPSMTKYIKERRPLSYKTCDLFKPADLKIDIQAIALPDCSFDTLHCSHVLEHVDDDRKAMSELFRILRPGGRAIVMVPIEEGLDETYENAAIQAPHDRLIHFGQEDHVRFYGRDLRDRLKGAGFTLREWVSKEPDVSRHGLRRGERVFICTRPV